MEFEIMNINNPIFRFVEGDEEPDNEKYIMKNGHSLPNGLEKNGGNGFKHEMEEKEINEETGEKERKEEKEEEKDKKEELPTVGLIQLVSN